MKNLYLYSCSHGKTGNLKNHNWSDDNSWGQLLSSELGCNFINRSAPGVSNYYIFNEIYKDLDKISDNDIVIVQWTYITRTYQKDQNILPSTNNKISKIYYNNLYYDHQEANKVLGYTLLIDKLITNFFFNFADGSDYIDNISPNTFSIINTMNNYLKINSNLIPYFLEPQYIFECGHLNDKGHSIIKKLYNKKLKKLL